MSALINQARSRVPRIAEAAVERARLTVVPRRRRGGPPGCRSSSLVSLVLVGGVAGLLLLQHLDAAGVLHRDGAGGPGPRARRQAAVADRWSSTRLRDPQRVAVQARRWAWCRPTSPAFLRLSDGKVLGTATPAAADDALRITPLPTRKPKNLRPDADRRSRSSPTQRSGRRRRGNRDRGSTAAGTKKTRRRATSRGASVDPGPPPSPAAGPRPSAPRPPARPVRAPPPPRSARCAARRWCGCGSASS